MNEHDFFTNSEMEDMREAHRLCMLMEEIRRDVAELLDPKMRRVLKLTDERRVMELALMFPIGSYRDELIEWARVLDRVNGVRRVNEGVIMQKARGNREEHWIGCAQRYNVSAKCCCGVDSKEEG